MISNLSINKSYLVISESDHSICLSGLRNTCPFFLLLKFMSNKCFCLFVMAFWYGYFFAMVIEAVEVIKAAEVPDDAGKSTSN